MWDGANKVASFFIIKDRKFVARNVMRYDETSS